MLHLKSFGLGEFMGCDLPTGKKGKVQNFLNESSSSGKNIEEQNLNSQNESDSTNFEKASSLSAKKQRGTAEIFSNKKKAFEKIAIEISDADMTTVNQQIQQVWKKIQDKDFHVILDLSGRRANILCSLIQMLLSLKNTSKR